MKTVRFMGDSSQALAKRVRKVLAAKNERRQAKLIALYFLDREDFLRAYARVSGYAGQVPSRP